MTRITGADHVLLLLREKLAGAAAPGKPAVAHAAPRPLERLRAMAGLSALGEDDRRRAVVHALLVDELGDAVANDAGFRDIAEEVVQIIAAMPEGPAMVDRAAAALRGD